MRKALGLLSVASLLVSLTVIAAGPAGSAAAKPTCKKVTGTVAYKPGLPAGKTTKVNSTATTTLNATGCTGGGVTAGKGVSSEKLKAYNCTVFLANKHPKPTIGTIKWVPKGTSTTKTSLKIVKLAASGIIVKATQVLTGGLFKGSTTTTTISANLNKGACGAKPLSLITFKNTTPLVTK